MNLAMPKTQESHDGWEVPTRFSKTMEQMRKENRCDKRRAAEVPPERRTYEKWDRQVARPNPREAPGPAVDTVS